MHVPRTPIVAPLSASDHLPLVGRANELARLEELLEARDGPRLIFVRGEGGVGKTRLVSELAGRAEGRGWDVARGRAYPVEVGTPYALFSDAWLPILNGMDSNALRVLSRGSEAELRCLFPAMSAGVDAPDVESGDPEELRTRILWNFAEFVKRYAGRTPLLLVLEDLQWADDSSIELVHFLARQVAGHPVVLVCTYKDQERDKARTLVQAERSLASVGAAEVLSLEPLSREQVDELVSRTFGVDGQVIRDFTAILYGWTRGNAFFVEEILKALISSGTLRYEHGTWIGWEAQEFSMPSSIRDAIFNRISGFTEDEQRALEMTAMVGAPASFGLLESITGMEPDALLSAVEGVCAAGVLDERPEGREVVYEFRHPLVRQTLYDEFGLQRVRVMHGTVAEAMERHFGPTALDHADELAYHFARTDGSRLRGKAARYLAAAGRRALERRADAEAISYLERALDRTQGVESSEDDQSVSVREILPLLARAHSHVGNFVEAQTLWTSALDALDADSPEYPGVCRALALTDVWRGEHDNAMAHLAAGLTAARGSNDGAAVVRILVAQSHALQEVGRGDDALAALNEALPIAEELRDARLLARVHRGLALLHVWVGPPEQAFEHGHTAVHLAQQVGDLSIEFWARWGLAVLVGMRGDTRAMGQGIKEIQDIADKLRSPVLRLWAADMAVELAFARGEWDTGITLGEASIETARALNQRTLLPRLLVWTSQFYGARGDIDRAEALVQEAVDISGLGDESKQVDVHQVVPTYIGLALHHINVGDFEDAIDVAERGLQIAEGTGYILWAVHRLLPALAEACLWAGHIDRAEEVGRRLRGHAEKIDHRLGIAWSNACEALVKWKRGDPAGSVDLMSSAVEELSEIPMIWTATRLRRQLAGRYADIGRRDEALEELHTVHAVLIQVRAGLELEKTRRMYRELDVRPPPIRSEEGPLGLTPSEFSVARLVAQGLSNKAIGRELDCATRTVSTHLSNIYTKLDIGGPGARMRLSNLVAEAGPAE